MMDDGFVFLNNFIFAFHRTQVSNLAKSMCHEILKEEDDDDVQSLDDDDEDNDDNDDDDNNDNDTENVVECQKQIDDLLDEQNGNLGVKFTNLQICDNNTITTTTTTTTTTRSTGLNGEIDMEKGNGNKIMLNKLNTKKGTNNNNNNNKLSTDLKNATNDNKNNDLDKNDVDDDNNDDDGGNDNGDDYDDRQHGNDEQLTHKINDDVTTVQG